MGGCIVSKSRKPVITVVCGGCSSEREVSLVSGRAVCEALEKNFEARLRVLDAERLPDGMDPSGEIVFPALHGRWGEDGGIQGALEAGGFAYAGCGPQSSALCMDKVRTKAVARQAGIAVVPEVVFEGGHAPEAAAVVAELGEQVVIKPVGEGSSVGLRLASGVAETAAALALAERGRWMVEPRIFGREFAVGVLEGEVLGVVEIKPEGGVYDYAHKYTAGATCYEFPAKLEEAVAGEMREAAQKAFAACRCRDFARVDFMMDQAGGMYLLEINTIPGLTPTSLLPKSASCCGMDFPELARRMAGGALARWRAAYE